MPNISWDELSDIRHKVADNANKLYKIEMIVRDLFRSTNYQVIAHSALEKINDVRDGLVKTIDNIDDLTIKHESEL